MRDFFLTTVFFVLVSLGGVNSWNKAFGQETTHKVTVTEVIQTTNYTYLQVKEDNKDVWLAVPKISASPGEIYYHDGGMLMKDFKSAELNRTFDDIYFVGVLRTTFEVALAKNEDITNHNKPDTKKENIAIKPIAGGVTIAELFANKSKYAGKVVKIKGNVMKFNSKIMNNNWIHLQDGTSHDKEFDLIITTKSSVKVGDTIIIEGKISLDKDFGYGYKYSVLMEDAILK